MILADTSAWIEYLRATGSVTDLHMIELVKRPDDLLITEVVVMEVLAGARRGVDQVRLKQLLYRHSLAGLDGLPDFEVAALLYLTCRQAGETVRKMTDCMIAAVAIRNEVELLAVDRDFEAIARHTQLRLVST